MKELLYQPNKIVVDGKEYKQERLQVLHVFSFIKVLKKARIVNYFGQIINDFMGEEITREEQVAAAVNLVLTLVDAETEIYDLFGNLVGVSGDEFKKLPPEVLIDVIENIMDAPDLKAFLKALGRLLPKGQVDATLPVAEAMTAPVTAE